MPAMPKFAPAPATAPDRQSLLKASEWRLWITVDGDRGMDTFAIAHDTEVEAYADVKRFLELGVAVRSDTEDVIEHDRASGQRGAATYYPMARVLSMKIGKVNP